MRHKPRDIALLSTLAVLALGASASAASAAISFEWKVGGSPLASGASKEFTVKDKGSVLLHLKISFGGAPIEFTSSKLKVQKGAAISGGKPGASNEVLELEGVKVARPAGCQVKEEKITMDTLKSEIVESASAGVGSGKSKLLFTPKNGTAWNSPFPIESTPTETCVLGGTNVELKGSLLALTGPQKAEEKTEQLIVEETTKLSNEYKVSAGGAAKKAALEWAGNPAILTGEAEMELVSKEAFGAF